MKHILKKGFSLLLAMMLTMGLSATAFAADSSVTFENGKLIAFAPGSTYTDSDLFDNFKGVMPGDTLHQTVTIQNKSKDFDYIKVYMRAVPHDENGNPISEKVLAELKADNRRGEKSELAYMVDFLSQFTLTVKNGGSVIYNTSPDKADGLASNVYLGQLREGNSMNLDVELTVPIEMGNDYANRIGEVDWVFVVEGFDDVKPGKDPDPEPEPKPKPDPIPSTPKPVTVRKVWKDDGIDRPDSITVQLFRDGKVYDEVRLDQSNQWTYTWDRLSKGHKWNVEEADIPDGFEASYKTRGNTVTIINTETEPAPVNPAEPVDLTVVKKWDAKGNDHPDSAKITLYDGETAVETVGLGDWNDWTYTWKDLDGSGNWQVIETDIPKGYVPTYSSKDGVVTVTNMVSLIQTGQLNWPIPVMGGLGLAFVAYGIFAMTKKRKNKRA